MLKGGPSVAVCIVGRHGGEGHFHAEGFRNSVLHVTQVLERTSGHVEIFATPGPFNASLRALLRESAGNNEIYFDTKKHISFEELGSIAGLNATRWSWAFRNPHSLCRSVRVDENDRCVATGYLIAYSWKSCARLITAVDLAALSKRHKGLGR